MFQELILIALLGCSVVYGTMYTQCCPEGKLILQGGYCENNTQRISLNCTVGHMLLKDIVLNGTKVSTIDTPKFIIVEDTKE